MRDFIAGLVLALIVGAVYFVSPAHSQTPQGAVNPSYVGCKDKTFKKDPQKIRYGYIHRRYGTVDNPKQCLEVYDRLAPGGYCQMAFYCEET